AREKSCAGISGADGENSEELTATANLTRGRAPCDFLEFKSNAQIQVVIRKRRAEVSRVDSSHFAADEYWAGRPKNSVRLARGVL
ncbi:MAG: hypothetical protein ABI442_06645, partial [Gemmatimonadaceae bacterium]